MRSLFKFVSYWNPAVRPDAEGRATIRFELPDNLTGWRILAVAVTPEDRLGLGQGTVRVNEFGTAKPIQVRTVNSASMKRRATPIHINPRGRR